MLIVASWVYRYFSCNFLSSGLFFAFFWSFRGIFGIFWKFGGGGGGLHFAWKNNPPPPPPPTDSLKNSHLYKGREESHSSKACSVDQEEWVFPHENSQSIKAIWSSHSKIPTHLYKGREESHSTKDYFVLGFLILFSSRLGGMGLPTRKFPADQGNLVLPLENSHSTKGGGSFWEVFFASYELVSYFHSNSSTLTRIERCFQEECLWFHLKILILQGLEYVCIMDFHDPTLNFPLYQGWKDAYIWDFHDPTINLSTLTKVGKSLYKGFSWSHYNLSTLPRLERACKRRFSWSHSNLSTLPRLERACIRDFHYPTLIFPLYQGWKELL